MKLFRKKSYNEVEQPSKNTLLRSLFYAIKMSSGIPIVMEDDPDSYLKDGYGGNADVFSIINRITCMSRQARLALYTIGKSGRWEEVTDHELVKFTKKANATMSMRNFQEGHLVYKLTIGNVYWYLPTLKHGTNAGNRPEIWLMPSNNVEIVGSGNWMNPISGYVLRDQTDIEFDPLEVYHSKFFNPFFGERDKLYGMSPLKAAAETVSKQNVAEKTELKQFENQSPPYLLYRDIQNDYNGLTQQQRAQIEDIFKGYSKKYKSGHPIILPDKFGAIKLGISPSDLNILESSQEGRRILCNIYNLPSELFNDKSASTYNNVLEAKKSAWTDCIQPELKDFADSLTSALILSVPKYENSGLFFAFDYANVPELQKDKKTMVEWMRQAYWSPNEIREATGADPLKIDGMDEPWIGIGENPISQSGNMDDIFDNEDLKDFGDYIKK